MERRIHHGTSCSTKRRFRGGSLGPFAELSRLNHQMQRYVDNWRDLPSIFGEGFAPLADVEETDDAFVPADLDEDGVSAELDEGVLIVRVPKAASERPRRITV